MSKKTPKKESLKNILTALIPYRNLAEGFLTIIEESNDKQLENQILSIIYKGVKSIKSEKDRIAIKNKFKELQNKNNYEDEKDKKEADKIMNDFINNLED